MQTHPQLLLGLARLRSKLRPDQYSAVKESALESIAAAPPPLSDEWAELQRIVDSM